MAHRVLADAPPPEGETTKTVYKNISRGISSTLKKTPVLIDALVILTIAFWFFFFTGLAIVFGRKIPKEWLKIATQLSRGKIAAKVKGKEVIKKPSNIRVVDLETHQEVRPISVS